MTTSGAVMNTTDPFLPRFIARPVWKSLSASFAKGANGEVHYLFDAGATFMKIDSKAVWRTTEFPILRATGIKPTFVPFN